MVIAWLPVNGHEVVLLIDRRWVYNLLVCVYFGFSIPFIIIFAVFLGLLSVSLWFPFSRLLDRLTKDYYLHFCYYRRLAISILYEKPKFCRGRQSSSFGPFLEFSIEL